jgi:hypothetical protein
VLLLGADGFVRVRDFAGHRGSVYERGLP